MKTAEEKRFNHLYQRHQSLLKLQGKSEATIKAYSRAVRRARDYFDVCPDSLTKEQLEIYFGNLIEERSWSTVKIDRLGLMFFFKHVLERDWQWLDMVKPPQVKTIPDILTPSEIEQMIRATKKVRYRVFILTTYSMGLRLSETLALEVRDIDAKRQLVHVRRGKGCKDRMVPLPHRTLEALRFYWQEHRHPRFLFPNPKDAFSATKTMDKGGAQNAVRRVIATCKIKKKYQSIPFAIHSPRIFLSRA